MHEPGLLRREQAHADHDIGVGEQLDDRSRLLHFGDAADQARAGDDRHVDRDAVVRALVELERVLEVRERTGDHTGIDAAECRPLRDLVEVGDHLELLLGVLLLRLLAPQRVDLGPELLVLLADVVVVPQAVPRVAHRAEDPLGTVPDRAEHGRRAVTQALDRARAAEVQREDRHRGEDQQDQREAGSSSAPREGHGSRGCLAFAVGREQHALQRVELLERLARTDGDSVQRVGGDDHRHPRLVLQTGVEAVRAARRRRRGRCPSP